MIQSKFIPNQNRVYLNRYDTKGSYYVNFHKEYTYDIIDDMTSGEMKVYFYLCSQVPDTYNGVKNQNCKRLAPFALSPQAIKNKYPSMDIKTIRNGIEKLIQKGFIKELSPGIYQFDDIPLKYRSQTIKEHEELQNMTAEQSYALAHKQELENLVENNQEEINEDEELIYDWMLDEEIEEIKKRNAARRVKSS